uniref:Universal stress protein n=1 Tax=Schistosoma japonicum TaxID=6182 RepID=C1L4K4_SCHJA|nr:Universal stress protein [Schistosoma japonicum]
MTSECSRRVLLPIDGSEHSKRAVNWYLTEFCKPDDHTYFLHVVESHYSKTTAIESHDHAKELSSNLNKNIKSNAHLGKLLGDKLHDDLEKSHIQMEYIMQIGNKPGELIVDLIKKLSVDVVLIGNRGLGALRRTFLGSVSEYVLHHCNVPFIIIPPPLCS